MKSLLKFSLVSLLSASIFFFNSLSAFSQASYDYGIYLYKSPSMETVNPGAKNVTVGTYLVRTSQSDVSVNAIYFIMYGQNVSKNVTGASLATKDGDLIATGKFVGNYIFFDTEGGINVPKYSGEFFDLKVDISGTAEAGEDISFAVRYVVAYDDGASSASGKYSYTTTKTKAYIISPVSSVKISADTDVVPEKIVLAGSQSTKVGVINLEASDAEDVVVESVFLNCIHSGSWCGTNKLILQDPATGAILGQSSVSISKKTLINFDNPFVIKKGTNRQIIVMANILKINQGVYSGETLNFEIVDLVGVGAASGLPTNVKLGANTQTNLMIVRKGIPDFGSFQLENPYIVLSIEQDLYNFRVLADPAGDSIAIGQLTFEVKGILTGKKISADFDGDGDLASEYKGLFVEDNDGDNLKVLSNVELYDASTEAEIPSTVIYENLTDQSAGMIHVKFDAPLKIASGKSVHFILRADLPEFAKPNDAFTINLQVKDPLNELMTGSFYEINDNIRWSDLSTSLSPGFKNKDWTNSYLLSPLGLIPQTLTY